jgi:hypothetical protein
MANSDRDAWREPERGGLAGAYYPKAQAMVAALQTRLSVNHGVARLVYRPGSRGRRDIG